MIARYRLLSTLLLGAFLTLPLAAKAATGATPFAASYRLEVRGWPNATIDHRLTRDGASWYSEMRGSIAVARGRERSRFLIQKNGVNALQYASGYSLLGFGGDYRLAPGDLTELPDRQAALFELSRRAVSQRCESTCELRYLDHRGRETRLEFRSLARETLRLPAGEFEAVRVEVTEPDSPERRMEFSFHPELPGLLLAVDYHRDGEQRSRLSLTSLNLDTP
ncbi:hypothetical protein HOP52_10390 [Halomonas campisalis]|uniref:DUF3108 domain-containing protein n=1 Tax=Billgrantia campisalis TaxID=74661 RepID=A0ABS9PA84_9GAMM|nr:hypothetical protein [Halomonas campisalis]MCG6658162.1 hypothetical protein [Halomonas campisalis]MDR5862831.1 hypothetical protein [Halomonas campisalis]